MKIDYLIIGQGIAGSVLSYKLLQKGCRVMVVGRQGVTTSSDVAPGLFNPVTGRKMVKTWNADALFTEIEPTYRHMEELSGASFFHYMPIYRPFTDMAEQNDWAGRQADAAYSPYIARIYDKPRFQPYVNNPYGGIQLKQAGWIDIPEMLSAWRAYLQTQQSFTDDLFDEGQLEVGEEGVRYKQLEAGKVIYCNGTALQHSRYWGWAPLRPVKGEVLYLHSPVDFPEIINRGVFLLPKGEGVYALGSTYNQHDLSPEPTEAARKDMLQRLSALVEASFEIQKQATGIRPATKDRRPLAGLHPEHKTLALLNGLGTKGVSLAPYCAALLAEQLLAGKELSADINISRYFSLYYT